MDISLFDYELDSNLIAQKPCVPRDHSRLLNCTKEVAEDLRFKDLPSILNSGDVLVINNTKVIPSRLFGKRDKVNVEVTLHMKTNKNTWRAFLKPGRKCKINDTIIFQNNLKAKVIEKYIEGDVLLQFNKNSENVIRDVNYQGQMPLPPYIKRNEKNESDDKDYQTIFAEEDGAVSTDETVAEEIQEQGDKNKTNSDKIATKLRNLIDKYDNHTHPHPLGETDPTEKTEGDAGIDPAEME